MSSEKTILHDHQSREHAILSASSASRWMKCTASVQMSESYAPKKLPEEESSFASEGTVAHEIAEACLRSYIEGKEFPEFDEPDRQRVRDIILSGYVNPIIGLYEKLKESDENTKMFVEVQVDFSNVAPDGFGTSDCIVYGNRELHVIDLKFGTGIEVSAENNPQLRLYAIGALNRYDHWDELFGSDFDYICTTILQPRRNHMSSEQMTPKELMDWGNNVLKPLAERAWKGDGTPVVGEHCRFCPCKKVCPAQAKKYMDFVQIFANRKENEILSPEELSEILPIIDGADRWVKDVKEAALEEAILGEEIQGFKLVRGRVSKSWDSTDHAVSRMKQVGLTDDEIWQKKLITPSQAADLVDDDAKETLKLATVYRHGTPILVGNSDEREAIPRKDVESMYGLDK